MDCSTHRRVSTGLYPARGLGIFHIFTRIFQTALPMCPYQLHEDLYDRVGYSGPLTRCSPLLPITDLKLFANLKGLNYSLTVAPILFFFFFEIKDSVVFNKVQMDFFLYFPRSEKNGLNIRLAWIFMTLVFAQLLMQNPGRPLIMKL